MKLGYMDDTVVTPPIPNLNLFLRCLAHIYIYKNSQAGFFYISYIDTWRWVIFYLYIKIQGTAAYQLGNTRDVFFKHLGLELGTS